MKAARWTLIIVVLGMIVTSLWLGISLWNSTRSSPFALTVMTNLPAGPKALFEQPRVRPSRLLPTTALGSSTRMWVLRHGQWTELQQGEASRRTLFDPVMRKVVVGRNYARSGYTFAVDVPVCEAWKVQLEIAETKRIGPKVFGFAFTHTNMWRSPELPGWSNIRREFKNLSESALPEARLDLVEHAEKELGH